MMKNRTIFQFPALSWTQICECRLEICCSVLLSDCVRYICLSRDKWWLEFCIGGWNRMLQLYIESVTARSDDIDDEEIARNSVLCWVA